MGKAKKSFSKARVNPLGVLTANDSNFDRAGPVVETNPKGEATFPVLKKLNAADAADRVWAAASISNLYLSNPTVRRKLLTTNVIGLLVERLTDDSLDVVVECLGTLRNLGTIYDPGLYPQMIRKNILVALKQLVEKASDYIHSLLQGEDLNRHVQGLTPQLVWGLADNVLSVLLILSQAVAKINEMNVAAFLMSFLNPREKNIPSESRIIAAQLFYTLTENNPTICKELARHSPFVANLFDILETPTAESGLDVSLPILTGGVLYNLLPFANLASEYQADLFTKFPKLLITVLSDHLGTNVGHCVTQACQLVKSIDLRLNTTLEKHPQAEASHKAIQQLGVEETKLNTLHLVLELLANVFTSDQLDKEEDTAEDDTKDENVSGEEEDAMDVESEAPAPDADAASDELSESDLADLAQVTTADYTHGEAGPDQAILEVFTQHILPKVVALAEPTQAFISALPKDLGQSATDADDIAVSAILSFQTSLHMLHRRALGCLNNFLLIMADSDDQDWLVQHKTTLVQQFWDTLFGYAHQVMTPLPAPMTGETELADRLDYAQFQTDYLDDVLGCLWCLARGTKGNVHVTEDQVQSVVQTYRQTTTSPGMRVKCVGIVGAIASRQPGYVDANRIIGNFLMQEVIEVETERLAKMPYKPATFDPLPIEPIMQAIDCLYDVYGDAEYDYDGPVFVQGQFLKRMESLQAQLKTLIKRIDARKHQALRQRANDVWLSYPEFLKYKKAELKRR
ncbi:hypothetical protein H4R34_000478 [Dimargaris verticillata]|uniref:SYO1-like TPR repeats domain-containing protein n=1 Tax=Dimargaris verticillata TaxID=2761393 RepID=A0A9W8EB89_9FUNG|nr:hypothetical protein H4R34_000478 [Dimargaris verticillata]